MLKSLRLDNFRRHGEVELNFDADSQIVLIAGSNGAGKSSILEAITYALYGQGRYGRNNLDSLVRRGAELEGMQVELEFEVADSVYRVERRRDNGASTAKLFSNARQIAVGADQVTSEISKILGMDAVGFKLATIAQQKELDGLAKLRPAVRAQQIRRLLRLDALTSAADEARATFRRERDLANALAGTIDFQSLVKDVTVSEKTLAAAEAALAEASAGVKALEEEISSTQHVQDTWQRLQLELASAQGAEINARSEVARLEDELARIVVPAEVERPDVSISELAEQNADVERSLVRADNAKQLIAHRDMLNRELTKVTSQKLGLDGRIEAVTLDAYNYERLEAELETAKSAHEALEKKVDATRQALADAQSALKNAKEHVEKAEDLSATCSHCGQMVSEEHRINEARFAKLELVAAEKKLEKAKTARNDLNQQVETAKNAVTSLTAQTRAASEAVAELARLQESVNDLARRAATYTSQIERIEVEDVDIDELYAQKAEIAILISSVQQASDQERVRTAVLTRQADLRDALDAANARHVGALKAISDAAIEDSLQEAYAKREENLTLIEGERELLNHFSTQKAVATSNLSAAQKALESAQSNENKRLKHQERAVTAANASRLLKDVADRLANQIRPALEGSVSQLLSTLSEGRFASVKIDADYNIRVEDDGKMQPMSEFSGGEMDLIALAVRLALAQVVSERHGAGGSGFLILDEVFGSQDSERREAILSSLRTLKGVYGQILLISHVGGLEDAADMVIDVTRTEDGPSEVKTN